MKILLHLVFFFVVFFYSTHGMQSDSLWSVDASVAFGILQEQAKNASNESGGRLFQSVTAALLVSGTHHIAAWADLGVFGMVEVGERSAADFGGVNSAGVPTPISHDGGRYSMFWIGPMVRLNWRSAFLDIGYVAFGVRDDTAYPTLTSPSGSSDEPFRTDPLRSWMFTAGMRTPMWDNVDLTLKIEYRYLYYDRRGDRLENDLVYGTQAIRPHIGLSFSL